MPQTTSSIISESINEAVEKFISEMTAKYPGNAIEVQIKPKDDSKVGSSIRSSEVQFFKHLAMSCLGTPGEMAFDDVERGFLRAALSDGMSGFKEYIENIPVETPVNSVGEKYRNNGKEKKTIVTALGTIKDVRRTVFRDDSVKKNDYPLDSKLNLLLINGKRSRYTQVFSHNAAGLYAELTEESAVSTLAGLLGIKIEKASLSKISQSIASKYIMTVQDESAEKASEQTESVNAADSTDGDAVKTASGFIERRLYAIDAHPDRDSIIQDALDGKLAASESSAAVQSVIYASADGTGVPGLKKELSSNGKSEGGAKTFEAKIGCVFKQGFDDSGLPILSNNSIFRLPDTTKYTGTVNKIDYFSPQFIRFAAENGVSSGAGQVVFLADGAPWLWKMQERLCPGAICIIDFYHASEHLNGMVDKLSFQNTDEREVFRKECRRILELGDIAKLEAKINSKVSPSNKDDIIKCLAYFTENAQKMRYGLFRAAGLFIGSGVIEAACKTIVGKRMKNAGMHWSKKNAEGIIALRCAIDSGVFDSDKHPWIAA